MAMRRLAAVARALTGAHDEPAPEPADISAALVIAPELSASHAAKASFFVSLFPTVPRGFSRISLAFAFALLNIRSLQLYVCSRYADFMLTLCWLFRAGDRGRHRRRPERADVGDVRHGEVHVGPAGLPHVRAPHLIDPPAPAGLYKARPPSLRARFAGSAGLTQSARLLAHPLLLLQRLG